MQKSKADKAALLQSACTSGDPYHSLSAASESPSPGPGGAGSAGAGTYGSSSGLAGRFRSSHQTVANVPTPAPNPDAPRNNTVNPNIMVITSLPLDRDSLFFRVPRFPVSFLFPVLLSFFFLLRSVNEVRHELYASPSDPADHFQQLHHRISPVVGCCLGQLNVLKCKCKKGWCQNGRESGKGRCDTCTRYVRDTGQGGRKARVFPHVRRIAAAGFGTASRHQPSRHCIIPVFSGLFMPKKTIRRPSNHSSGCSPAFRTRGCI